MKRNHCEQAGCSTGTFGAIYLFSGNLWLTAFAHASTDYALLAAIISSPILGLVFMFIIILVARLMGRNGLKQSQQ